VGNLEDKNKINWKRMKKKIKSKTKKTEKPDKRQQVEKDSIF
jgi:hypothetical protein